MKEKPKTEREKVEERREEVLSKGRKFKYPMQYAKHKLVVNTVIVAVVAIVLMIAMGWAMLYKFQDTSDMIYRVTQVVPVPVASVDGEWVRYSDYLMIYRSNLLTAEQQGGQLGTSAEADAVRTMYKQAALQAAVEYTYALKLAKELGLTVTNEEIDQAFDEHRKVGGVERSEESFLKIVSDNFGMSKAEYRRMLYLTLMKAKVEQAIDKNAEQVALAIEQSLAENGNDLAATAEALGAAVEYEETGGLVKNTNVDGGRSAMASTLEVGAVSARFLSSNGDGYYYVKLLDKTDSEVSYASIKVSFMEFAEQVVALYETGKVKGYIEVETETGADSLESEAEAAGGAVESEE